jgi:hypothetical protein
MNANIFIFFRFACIRVHSRFFRPRLVDLFDDLKREDDIRDLARFAVPDEFDLPLVLEQQKAVLLRQRLIRLDEADDLLLLRLRQTWHCGSLLRGVLLVRQAGYNRLGATAGLSSSAEARVGKPPMAPVKLNLADHYRACTVGHSGK